MLYFLIGMFILVAGYFTYGRLVERIMGPDDRETPAVTQPDGVDYVVLPHWKNMLIQLLNIAGIGPVIGVILGIKFGAIVFLILPVGNIIGGAVHDFAAGMMSLRHNGENLPGLVRRHLGTAFYWCFSCFMIFLLLLVVAVFINVPANLVKGLIPGGGNLCFYGAVTVIFLYYIAATLFPVDKIIGAVYPYFGALLILSSFLILGVLMYRACGNPTLLSETATFRAGMMTAVKHQPIIPLLFVTIACGIISGFHGTQSPIIARTMRSERQARSSFYGMMVVEGIIGMIWAAGGMAIYNMRPELMSQNPSLVLCEITKTFLGTWIGGLTVLGVIVLAVTSGDTAMRSLRLSLAEIFKLPQKPMANRIFLCLPLIVLVLGLLWWSNMSAKSFSQLWNYFAWGNQVLAASTLMAATVWLCRCGKKFPAFLITLIPGCFMTFIVLDYILWISPAHKGPLGFGMELHASYWAAGILTALLSMLCLWQCRAPKHVGECHE
ncbi:MAG: carbon starvation CstA family protein [Victivallaceae bacterium]|nr:carbon starvation CstA family protein [Victivallaceae bacterium]